MILSNEYVKIPMFSYNVMGMEHLKPKVETLDEIARLFWPALPRSFFKDMQIGSREEIIIQISVVGNSSVLEIFYVIVRLS